MMENPTNQPPGEPKAWLDRPVVSMPRLSWEVIIFSLLIIAAFATRFYDLEARVMSHDETSHVYFSWLLYRGQGYAHDPVTHGPFQFHVVALSYFLFGDNDLTARIPAVLFNIATIAFIWNFRRYLGRAGALVGGLMLLISPYILYYGRYVRNEAFVGFFGLLTIWAILRYLDNGSPRYLYWLTAATVLHITTKETAYIYTAQALLFLAIYLVYRLTRAEWKDDTRRDAFVVALILALLLLTATFASSQFIQPEVITPDGPSAPLPPVEFTFPAWLRNVLLGLSVLTLGGAGYFLFTDFGLPRLRQERSFSLLMLLGTLILPQLTPMAVNFVGWKIPVNASEVSALGMTQIVQIAAFLVPIAIISVALGLWWNSREWLINAGIFYGIFTVLYTTLFTNGAGFFTGLLGSLGYWLAQQGVERGSQPLYYYALLQVPFYEFLPALAGLFALGLGVVCSFRGSGKARLAEAEAAEVAEEKAPTFWLLAFWSLTSLAAYTIAGERMPWLTFHITLPLILLSAWGIGWLIDHIDWQAFHARRGWITLLLVIVLMLSLSAAIGSLLSPNPPFAGKSLDQLSETSTFLVSALTAIGLSIFLGLRIKDWRPGQAAGIFLLVFFAFLALLTTRSAFLASYINYDNATEFLVYAHSGPGVKQALAQIEDISRRTTGTLEIAVAYDNDTTYPYWWYLRNYSQQRFYGGNPTRDLRDAPLILVGDNNYGKLEPIVGQAYYQFDYIRIWWPNQDYYGLTWQRIWDAVRSPEMRHALYRIWMYRDYSEYGRLTNKDMSLSNWSPAGRMRLYVRKDIASTLWDYGSAPAAGEIVADPYEGKQIELPADQVIGGPGSQVVSMQRPRGIAVAPDGSLYVSDTGSHRILHIDTDGVVLHTWGSFADIAKGAAPGGTFYEPWGLAVDPYGAVYVADTWNHRIQKFTADGQFLTMWGYFGQAETPTGFWGPRSVAVDATGLVYVTDTGNKRVVIFDGDGNFVKEFGTVGFQPGEFDEPVGLAVAPNGTVYVADTWNQRLQAMQIDASGQYTPSYVWDVVAWYGQSLENKPYLAIGSQGNLFAADPEGYRILEFQPNGDFVRYWGSFGAGPDGLNLPTGIAADPDGGLWVVDSGNNRIVHFTLP